MMDVTPAMATKMAACLRPGIDHVAATEEGASALYDIANAIDIGSDGGTLVEYTQF